MPVDFGDVVVVDEVFHPINLVTPAREVYSEGMAEVPVDAGYQDVRVSTHWL